MMLPEARLTIWTEAPPTSKPVQLRVMLIGSMRNEEAAFISAEEFERTMNQWLALSKRKIVPT